MDEAFETWFKEVYIRDCFVSSKAELYAAWRAAAQKERWPDSSESEREDVWRGLSAAIVKATGEQVCLPCPFCAGHATIEKRALMEWPWQIVCNECGAMSDLHISEEHAVGAWNKRVTANT